MCPVLPLIYHLEIQSIPFGDRIHPIYMGTITSFHHQKIQASPDHQVARDMTTRAAMTDVLPILFILAAVFIAGDACDNVPSMSSGDACHKACDGQPWYGLCPDTLRSAPDAAELTVYALVAARQATLKYEDTMATLDQMLGAGNLPAGERPAVDKCVDKYREAHGLMASVADQLSGCDFTRARQEYVDAQTAVGTCQNALWSYQGLQLYAMVSADLNLTMVAYDLGALIVGK
ncbi:hypothetical protein ACP70R_003513 [Stipagrostis hirtigluma subsp. patula]